MTGPKVLALDERLAELGYLPFKIDGAIQPKISLSNLNSPPNVSFTWRYAAVPPQLASQWSPATYTEMTRAAVISVEHVNGLPIDGDAGEGVWKAILPSNALTNPNPYTYVLVTKNPAPEELRVWQSGKWVYQSIANTGVTGAPTIDGTFAVYERFISQTMTGTNPDGTKYDDPGVPYVNYYNGGEAIHGFPRASYGFPQSVGCVELPIGNAEVVWSLLNYGTLVTVEGTYAPPTPPTTTGKTSQQSSGQGNSTSNSTSTTDGSTGKQTSGSGHSSGKPGGQKTGNTGGTKTGNTSSNSTSNSTGNSTGSPSNNSTNNTSDNSSNNSTGNTAGSTTDTNATNTTA